MTEVSRTFRAVRKTNPVQYEVTSQITSAIFQINNAKLYVPVVTLSIIDNIKVLENTKQGFKRTISWNKYRSETKTQAKRNNLDYLTDPTFRNINRFFVLSLKNRDEDPKKNSFDSYYIPVAEIKKFNGLIDNNCFFGQSVNDKQQAYEILIAISKIDDYATRNLLDNLYHQKYYRLTGIYLSRQTNRSIPQNINFVGKSEDDNDATMFFIVEKQQKTILNFALDSLIVTDQHK